MSGDLQLERLREFAYYCIDSYQEDEPKYPHDGGYRAKGRFVAKWAYEALMGQEGTPEDIQRLQQRNRPRFILKDIAEEDGN